MVRMALLNLIPTAQQLLLVTNMQPLRIPFDMCRRLVASTSRLNIQLLMIWLSYRWPPCLFLTRIGLCMGRTQNTCGFVLSSYFL